ncbi:MAG TPA: hypothetical protein VJQ25_10860, partial [Nitrospira sp.]|nr:hypothetical protein [Nitrospira sp.]
RDEGDSFFGKGDADCSIRHRIASFYEECFNRLPLLTPLISSSRICIPAVKKPTRRRSHIFILH